MEPVGHDVITGVYLGYFLVAVTKSPGKMHVREEMAHVVLQFQKDYHGEKVWWQEHEAGLAVI